jgi:6-pyruvoyl-tetrahydropterin synthase
MKLTINRRFEFCAATQFGSGHNFVAYFVLGGKIQPETGMILHLSEVKERVEERVLDSYDHGFLKEESLEDIAVSLLKRAGNEFEDVRAVHLVDEEAEATAFSDGRAEQHMWLGNARVGLDRTLFDFGDEYLEIGPRTIFGVRKSFSATHQLADDRFGKCAQLHGHRFTLDVAVESDRAPVLDDLAIEHVSTTCEHLTMSLWKASKKKFGNSLYRLRLSETANNRFTVRR